MAKRKDSYTDKLGTLADSEYERLIENARNRYPVLEISDLLENKDFLDHINSHGPGGATPLIWACKYGHIKLVESLISLGADVNILNKAGVDRHDHGIIREDSMTPLLVACLYGHDNVASFLKGKGALMPTPDIVGDLIVELYIQEESQKLQEGGERREKAILDLIIKHDTAPSYASQKDHKVATKPNKKTLSRQVSSLTQLIEGLSLSKSPEAHGIRTLKQGGVSLTTLAAIDEILGGR